MSSIHEGNSEISFSALISTALIFSLDEALYAVNAGNVRETVRLNLGDVAYVPIPDNAGLMGVIGIRGAPVPVLSLRAIMRSPHTLTTGEMDFIVVDDAERDDASLVVAIPVDFLTNTDTKETIIPQVPPAIERSLLWGGVIFYEDHVTPLLSVKKLFNFLLAHT